MAACGATRLCKRGEGNAAVAELFDQFDNWETELFQHLDGVEAEAVAPTLEAHVDSDVRKRLLQHDTLQSVRVISNEVISRGEVEIKRRIVLELPEGTSYRAGDYIGLLPSNPIPVIQRALNRFKLHADDVLTLKGIGGAFNLPLDTPVSAFDLLAAFVELDRPISLKQVERLLQWAPSASPDRHRLEEYCEPETYKKEVQAKHLGLLSLLEEFPGIEMPFGEFLIAQPSFKIRQVSSEIVTRFRNSYYSCRCKNPVFHFVVPAGQPSTGCPHHRRPRRTPHVGKPHSVSRNRHEFPLHAHTRQSYPRRHQTFG